MGRKKLYTPATFEGPMTPTERCPKSKKLIFESKDAAEQQASAWAYQNTWEARVYKCPDCPGWHISRLRE